MTLIGARKPVLFIEGDSERSIDAKLYPLIFPDYNVRSLGSCNKVIEATRTFNDLNTLHKVESCGIVDRDRRDDAEVAYLRRKKIMVPDVAEIENLLLIEDIISAMAESRHRSADRAVQKVRRAVINMFRGDLRQQALLPARPTSPFTSSTSKVSLTKSTLEKSTKVSATTSIATSIPTTTHRCCESTIRSRCSRPATWPSSAAL